MRNNVSIYSISLFVIVFLVASGIVYAAPVTVTSGNTQGWRIIPDGTVPIIWSDSLASTGTGSIQFGPISGADPANKFIMEAPYIGLASSFGISYDYFVGTLNASHFYLNIYIDDGDPATNNWFDCRYDFVPSGPSGNWNTFSITGATIPTNVTARNGATCDPTLGTLGANYNIFNVAINGGQSNATDAGLEGAFDNVIITTATGTDTYDFEPISPDGVAEIVIPAVPSLNDWNATAGESRAEAYGMDDNVYATVHMQDGAWQYNAGGIPQDLIDNGVILAIDVWELGGDQFFDDYEKVCVLGEGRLIYFDATLSPRPMVEITPVTFEDGYTCGWIPNAGTLILIEPE
jgi:hypothetical protein